MADKKIVCIYHKDCLDGGAAAWVVRKFFGDTPVEFLAANYVDPLPDITNALIYIVDFSYKRDQMIQLMEHNDVVVIDHHDSAAKELAGIFEVDQSRSGAVLTWKYFFGDLPIPQQLLYAEDRDLWNWDLPLTRAFTNGAFTYPLTVDGVTQVMEEDINVIIQIGKPLADKVEAELALITPNIRRMDIAGYNVPAVNANHSFASDLGALMSKDESFAVIYYDTDKGRKYSLRSKKGVGVDVTTITKQFGGGGHVNAGGFTIFFDDPRFGTSHCKLDPLPKE